MCIRDRINSIVLWILSLPLLFFPSYAVFSYAGILSTVVVGLFYLVQSKKPAGNFAFLSVAASIRRRKRIWILWGLFFIVSTVTIAAVTFGSYLWYGWPVDISGPYQTANIAIRFYLPLLTIAVPITVGNFTKILLRNETVSYTHLDVYKIQHKYRHYNVWKGKFHNILK